MSSYGPPLCLSCQFLNSFPQFIGDSGHCSKYKKVPQKIFYESGKCQHYKASDDK